MPSDAHDSNGVARAQRSLRELFPSRYRATQRAVLTVGKRQYVCDGFLVVSPAEGWHLALVSTLGLIADVRVRTDGTGEVLKVTPLFREEWSREYVTRELRWLFAPPPDLAPLGRLADGRRVLGTLNETNGVRARYVISQTDRWDEFELSRAGRRLFHAGFGGYRTLDGCAREMPTEITVDAGTHRLHLRMVEWSVPAASATEGTR